MALIKDVFNETFPQLAEQLKEIGITHTPQLVERFKSNGKFLNELLDYDLKDNEKIRSIAEEAPTETSILEDEIEENMGKAVIGGFGFMIFIIIVGVWYIFFG